MFRAALFITAKKWKQPRCLSTNEQKNPNDHMMGYYQASKCMMCSYMIQHGWPLKSVTEDHIVHFYEMSKINESIETESRLGIAKKLRRRNGRDNEYAYCQGPSSLRGGWTCSEIRCTVLWIYKTLLSWHFQMVNFMRCVNYISIFNWGKNFLIMKKYWAQYLIKSALSKLTKWLNWNRM